jgi:hypothetical protein
VTALAKRFGVARTTIQRRLKRGWVPLPQAPHKPRAYGIYRFILIENRIQGDEERPVLQGKTGR